MPVLTRLMPSPVVVDIEYGALDDLATILTDQRIAPTGKLAFAISNGASGKVLRERFAPAFPGADWFDDADGTIDGAVKLADSIKKAGRYDAVVSLGGGKVVDCAKYAAARVGLPLVAVATNLAHDGLCSPVATLDNDAGRGSYGVPSPIGVVIDLDVIRDAPARFVRAADRRCHLQDLRRRRLGALARGQRRAGRRPGRRHGPPGRARGAAAPGRHR